MEFSNFYNYNGLSYLFKRENDIAFHLQQLYDSISECKKNGVFTKNKIHLCVYQINNEHYNPFLTFLLQKNIVTQLLEFPSIEFSEKFVLSNDIFFESVLDYLHFLLLLKGIELDEKNVVVDGLYDIKDETYVFIDVTKCKIDIHDIYKKNFLWFALIDEIVNVKHVCNIKIHEHVTEFFTSCNQFMFLTDSQNVKYEIPIVAYVGKEVSKLNFTYMFGVTKSTSQPFMGPYYYFTNYKNAICDGGFTLDENGKNKKGGIVRFAIFLGKTTVKMNHIEDEVDVSDTKREKMDIETERLYEQLTNRISDYDGNWTNQYDSVFVPNLLLDNGEVFKKSFIYVLKNYNQQCSLSFHYVNAVSHNESFDETHDYNIM